MKYGKNENILNNSKIIKSENIINDTRLISKESIKTSENLQLSDSNVDINTEDYKYKDLRCLDCFLIPLLSLNSLSHSININCNFGHSRTINLEEYLQIGYNNNFINLKCNKCKKQILKNEIKNYFYCKECTELLCDNCLKKHNTMYNDHHYVNLIKFDTTCILHNETYDYYCVDCKKNICQYCSDDFHSEHNLIDLDDINVKRKEIKRIKENYLKERENYLNLPIIFNDLVNKMKQELDKIVNNIQNEIKFKESVINTYENKIDNYNAIINLKNLEFNIKPFNIDKNLTIIENINNLMKYANNINNNNVKDDKLNSNINNISKKSNNKAKVKKIKEKEIENQNGNEREKEIKINNELEKNNKVKTLKKYKTVYKKNFISQKNNYQLNEETENKTIIPIPNEINNNNYEKITKEIKQTNNGKSDNKKELNLKTPNSKINEENINNKMDERINDNNIINISDYNINDGINQEKKIKFSIKSHKNKEPKINTKLDNDEKKEKIKNNSLSHQNENIINNKDTFTLIKLFNNNELYDNEITQKEKLKENKKILKEVNNQKIENNKNKIKQKKIEENSSEEEDEEEEEEEEDDDEDSNEELDSDESEEEETQEEDEESEGVNENKEKKEILKKIENKKLFSNNKDIINKQNKENINENEGISENNDSFPHKKIYPKSNISTQNENRTEIYSDRKKLKNDFFNSKEKENSNKKMKSDNITKKLIKDINTNEFRPKSGNLKIKESNNTVCCIIEIRENIFACGFLLGEIDIYNVNYLNCLFTILEHKSRVNNIFLLKDKSILTSSYDYTMKKIKINNNNSYTVDFVFNHFKNVVYKGIELSNNDILSISFRGNINIFRTEKNNNFINYKQHEIANEEIYNVIELFPNKEIAFATDECLRFFSLDSYKNIGNVHMLEFSKGNNMIHINKMILGILLKHDIALINIIQRQIIYKCSLGNIGKPELISCLKDNTILVGISNNKYEKIQFLFKQFIVKLNKLNLIAEKLEEFDKKRKDDYARITSLVELKNKIIVYGTAGFEDYKLVGNIAIID